MVMSSSTKLVLAFVTLIIGLVLVGQIATTSTPLVKLSSTTENVNLASARVAGGQINNTYNFTVANVPSGWRLDNSDCATISNAVLKNQSGTTLTITTDYLIDTTNGRFSYKNSSTGVNMSNLNTSTISYDYCGNDYLTQSWSRTTINLVPGLFAIALLLIAVGLFYSIAKDYGIIQ